ncbi:PREDICTED: cellulose synthase-like protein G2 isoform X2 [Ipomoea nil]|uniref:cellulose synthase-like protein G2 isoform X2 n=1 Tax=Ipomoea nil TaxID=35883 RepID=UPI0009012971|nr:PREDICTED: cellulose synthase-like protein G2 isoform X2 [Ipomoea nil]
MEALPLHHCKLHKWQAFIHRIHAFIHSIALISIIYYRLSSIFLPAALPWLLVFVSEIFLSLLWLFCAAFTWRPVSRTVFPERLSPGDELPAIDVFVCTADPKAEPPLGVMNTVLSVMALDYPPEKLSVYLSDDGGASVTLRSLRETRRFSRAWVPFCREFGVVNRCPEAFFAEAHDSSSVEFLDEKERIKREYERFRERLRVVGEEEEDATIGNGQNHPPSIEVIGEGQSGIDAANGSKVEVPLVVYVSREKRPSSPHHFKAGALNTLLRVSGLISNSPYILVLDCDMYSNDPSSARQAMCFHLDPTISSSLAFVQFPQKFHNLSNNDIYTSALATFFEVKWRGMDGLRGPVLSGTCFYIKRKALYGMTITPKDVDITKLRDSFGPSSYQFTSSLTRSSINGNTDLVDSLLKETESVASCAYEKDTQWGKDIGFMYNSVVEDYATGFMLHCRGWSSVFCNPARAAFLGSATTNLNDTLVQGTRWNSGLLDCLLSRFCPLIYGLPRMPILDCFCYAYLAAQPLYCLPAWCLAVVPQLCLLNNLPIYPKVSSPWFMIYAFAFISPLAKYLWDVVISGGTTQTWWNEWRMWMIKSITAYFYGSLDAVMKLIGIRKASFIPTSKVVDEEQLNRYQKGIFDFQASPIFLVPLVTLTMLNMLALTSGIAKVLVVGRLRLLDEFFGQVFVSFFILLVNYPIVEGMVFRKDKGGISLRVTMLSALHAVVVVTLSFICFLPVKDRISHPAR